MIGQDITMRVKFTSFNNDENAFRFETARSISLWTKECVCFRTQCRRWLARWRQEEKLLILLKQMKIAGPKNGTVYYY